VGYHYDPKEIARGYAVAFERDRAWVSRGTSMHATRFYFADAAANQYMRYRADTEEARAFLSGSGMFMDQINQALYELVTRFVSFLGFAWRPASRA